MVEDEELEMLLSPAVSAHLREQFGVTEEMLNREGISYDEFMKFVNNHAQEDVQRYISNLGSDASLQNNENNSQSTDEINLFTKSFVSPITGETILLTVLPILDRISEIYYHTGVSILPTDAAFSMGKHQGLNQFNNVLSSFDSDLQKKLKRELGNSWKEILLANYNTSWDMIISKKIDKEKDKAAAKLRNDLINEKRINQSLVMQQDVNNSLLQMHRAKDELVKEKEVLQTISANLYDFVDPNNNNIHEYIDSKVEEFPPRRH